MKIVSMTATTHRIEAAVPLSSQPVTRAWVLVRVETDDGISGFGLSAGGQRYTVRDMVNTSLRPLLIGMDPLETERCFAMVQSKLNPRAQTGALSSALSAVDIALWDVKGKYLEQPIWKLLGGYRSTIPAYTTFGLARYDRDQLVEVARDLVAKGHDKLKVRVGERASIHEDAARVAAVREAVGDGVELMVDANYSFTPAEAIQLCRLFEPLGLAWFEEPVHGNDPRLLAQLRRRTTVPISAGQNEGSKARHREFLVNESVDLLQPNVVYVGGYTEGAKVAAMAQAWNTPIANGGGWPHYNMHLLAAVPNGLRAEFHTDVWNSAPMMYEDPPLPERGVLTLPDSAGLGLVLREDAMKDSLDDGES